MNHTKAIKRIIDVLKSDTTIYEKNIPGKLCKIRFGNPPQNNASYSTMLPCAYVTTLQSLQKIHPQFGHSSGGDLPDKTDYAVIIASASATTESAQRQLYELEYNVKKVLKKDRTFRNPENNDDPVFSRSVIADTFRDSATFGQNIETLTIVLQTESGDVNTISIGSVAELQDLPILDRPEETHITNYENIYNTARDLINTAPINHTDVFFAKIEYTKDRWDKLYKLHQNRTKIEFSVKRGNDTQTRNGRISQMQNGAGYDEIETVLFQIDILP